MGNLLFGSDSAEVPLTVRGTDGGLREVTVTTGEQHIDAGARRLGVSPRVLSFVDLLHVLSYPFLLFAAWLLHRRNSRDVVSSVLSLAVLLTIAAEQPSAMFLATMGVPRAVNVALYDLGNVLLLAGIMLFPHGSLSWPRLGLIAGSGMLFSSTASPTRLVSSASWSSPSRCSCSACGRLNRKISSSRSAGRCSASAVMRCCARSRSAATSSNGRPARSASKCCSRCSPA
jgi:hypothetical protein